MKISYTWLKEFIALAESPAEVSLILTNIGLEVEDLRHLQAVEGGLQGLVVGEVMECTQHPNADRLKVTKINIVGPELIQVVCGASNVAAGQKVVVATPGTTLYPRGAEAFKIQRSRIRGEVSEGMLCAEDEIGIGESHAGILVLDAAVQAGTPVSEIFKLEDDHVFEIGLTPNRADAASHLGVARDLAAYYKRSVQLPAAKELSTRQHSLRIPVIVENEQACPRYSSVTLTGVRVGDSPDWMKNRLLAIGVRPINTIVDITNYVLHELGQPLHAFDAARISGGKVVVKNCAAGTPFTTLDGIQRILSEDDLMICNADAPMCIAGVFGGAESGITKQTTAVFLESAWFDPVSIRKTSRRHGLKTDAAFRFERGTDPEMTVIALKRAAGLIVELAGGEIASEIDDFYPAPKPHAVVSLQYKNVARLIGQVLPVDTIRGILLAGGIGILSGNEDGLVLSIPPFKVDVTREVDVIEEILRLYGYNNIELTPQIRASLNPGPKPDPELIRGRAADLLAANGFYEILTNSLTAATQRLDPGTAVEILNPLSTELNVMRQTLAFSGLEVIAYNQKRKNADLKLFEFGKIYATAGEGFREQSRLAIFMTGVKQPEQWNSTPGRQSFHHLKAAVDLVLKRFSVTQLKSVDLQDPLFAYGLGYQKGEKALVRFGEISAEVLKTMDVEGEVFYADIDYDLLLRTVQKNTITYQEVSKFPAVRRDLSLLIDRAVTFAQLEKIARDAERKLLKEVNIFDVYEGKNLPAGRKSYALSFLLQDDEKTLTDQQIDAVMQKLIATLGQAAGAEIRK